MQIVPIGGICMKCLILLCVKNKKNIINFLYAEFAQSGKGFFFFYYYFSEKIRLGISYQ